MVALRGSLSGEPWYHRVRCPLGCRWGERVLGPPRSVVPRWHRGRVVMRPPLRLCFGSSVRAVRARCSDAAPFSTYRMLSFAYAC